MTMTNSTRQRTVLAVSAIAIVTAISALAIAGGGNMISSIGGSANGNQAFAQGVVCAASPQHGPNSTSVLENSNFNSANAIFAACFR